MQSNKGKRRSALLRGGFAALCAALTVVAAAGSASAAPTETVLYSFTGGSDGRFPFSGLIADSNGNLFGTTESGVGVVFKLSPGGTETVLYSFCSKPSCSDGAGPVAGLIADSKGNLYGTTHGGGGASGEGVVFKLSPGGTETVLYSFCSKPSCSDGAQADAGLIADSSGNLYGTTAVGGGVCPLGCGVVFKLSSSGTETVLHSFTGGSDGAFPAAGLIADSNGNLYGTTFAGGAPGCSAGDGCGTVFKLSPSGTKTVLYSFCSKPGCSDGANPSASLITDSNGNLYGTTVNGGASNAGVVFKLSPGGTETVLYSFTGGSDGGQPRAGLIADSNGNLYGTTFNGGAASNLGVVFKLSPSGTETVLHAFTGGSDGAFPFAGLIADSNGNLYSTTSHGGGSNACGDFGCGTVFKLTGTGFVTANPFSAFSGKLEINFGRRPNTDSFELKASFTLGSASNGINPPAEPVTLQVGTFTTTIPPGSFTGKGFGPFTFEGVINGVALEVRIAPTGAKRYSLQAEASNASLTGTVNPVPVTLSIGDDGGTTSIKAEIDSRD